MDIIIYSMAWGFLRLGPGFLRPRPLTIRHLPFNVITAAIVWGYVLAILLPLFVGVSLRGNPFSEWRRQPLRILTRSWICLAGVLPFIAMFWATFSPVRWDPTCLWSRRLRDVGDILLILVCGKAGRFCNIHAKLSGKLFRGVLWAEYGCAVWLTVTLLMRNWLLAMPSFYFSSVFLESVNLVSALASLLISTAAWRHSKGAGSESTSTIQFMVCGAATLSLRAASDIISLLITFRPTYSKREFLIGEVVSLHICLVVYVVSTVAIGVGTFRLATELQHSTVPLAVDRYGREAFEESDRDSGQIRLSDTP